MIKNLIEYLSKKIGTSKENVVLILYISFAAGLATGGIATSGLATGGVATSGLTVGLGAAIAAALVGGLGVWIAIASVIILGLIISTTWIAFFMDLPNIGFLIILIIILTELIFWFFDDKKPAKNKNIINFTIKRKFISLIKSVFITLTIFGTANLIKDYYKELLKWLGYIGAGLIILGILVAIFYVFVQINSLKYTKKRGKR